MIPPSMNGKVRSRGMAKVACSLKPLILIFKMDNYLCYKLL